MRMVTVSILFAAAAFAQQATPQPIERTLQFVRTTTTQDFQEAVVLIRTIADIRVVTTDPVQRTLTLSAPADQVAMADWLFSQLDSPSGALPAGTPEYRISDTPDNILRLYHVKNADTVRDFQEMATLVRTMTDIRRVYTLNTPRIIGMRATVGQMAMAEWLFQEIDQPLTTARVPHEYFVPNSSNDVIRVFYFPLTAAVQFFQATATEIRKATDIRRMYTYNTPRAMAARGTIDQIAQAARMAQTKGAK